MNHPALFRRHRLLRIALGIGLCSTTSLPLAVAADELPAATSATMVAPAPMVLTLPDCIHMALERQPALAAQRSSVAAAQDNAQALQDIRVPTFISRELPFRRKQACLGVTIAQAALDQIEHETIYAVTRTYVTVLYARAQVSVANATVARLKATLESAQAQVQAGSKDVTTASADKITVYLRLAESRQLEAVHGIDRALAALKEAIGLDPCLEIQVPEDRLPEPQWNLTKENIIALALARRAELIQAGTLACVTGLEVEAQGTSIHPTMRTFAAVVDLHARPLPQGVSNNEYRPGAIGPEMPTTLVGPRSDRIARARDFSARMEAVVAKTRNLIALEAEDAYLRWHEMAQKVPATREAAQKASKLAEDSQKDFAGGANVKVEDVLTNEVLEAQARVQFNQALYLQDIALAALERITGGAFSAGLYPGAAPATTSTAPNADASTTQELSQP